MLLTLYPYSYAVYPRRNFLDEGGVFLNGVAYYNYIGAGAAVAVGFFGVGNAAADDEGRLYMACHFFYHAFGNRPTGATACIHVYQLHAQHFAGHRRAHGYFVFVGRYGGCVADVRNRGGSATVYNHVAGGHNLQAALLYQRGAYHMLTNEQLGVAAANEAQVQQGIGIAAYLAGAARKQDDGDFAASLYVLHAAIEMVADNQAAAQKKVVYSSVFTQADELVQLGSIHLIGVNKYGKALFAGLLALQKYVVHPMLHAEGYAAKMR